MAVPLEMPWPLPVNKKAFDLLYNQEITPVGGGFIQTIERSTPLWMAQYSTPPLNDARYAAMVEFLDGLEGAKNNFIGYDPRRPVPLAYMGTPGALDPGFAPWGSANVTDSSHTLSTLTLSFGTSTILTRGDYVSYVWDGAIWLHRINENKVGSSMTVLVKPRPLADVSGELRMVRCGAEMKMLGRPKWDDSVDSLPTVSFTGVQIFNRVADI